MIFERESTEDEMVAGFLKGEVESRRFGERLQDCLVRFGVDSDLVSDPDLADVDANAARARVLGCYRGWKNASDPYLFRDWADNVTWTRERLEADDLPRVRYAKCDPWDAFSRFTYRVPILAKRVKNGDQTLGSGKEIQAVRALVELMRAGATFQPIVVLTDADRSTIALVEGHSRYTAHTIVGGAARTMPAFVATADPAAVEAWRFWPPRVS